MGTKGTEITKSDIAFELLANHCDSLLNRIRVLVAKDKLTPDSVEATELIVNIEIFLAMEKAKLGAMHPDPMEVDKWSETFLCCFDEHSSEMWDPSSEWVSRRRKAIQKTFKSLLKVCEEYHGPMG